jgi:anti-anti-sigma factor
MDLAMERDNSVEGLTILVVRGGADLFTTPLLRKYVAELITKNGPRLLVELGAVGFLGPTACQALIDAREQAVACGGFLCLIDPPEYWDTRALGFPTFDSRAEAIEQLPRLRAGGT